MASLSTEEQLLELRAMIEIVAENAGLKNRLNGLVAKKMEEMRAKMPKQEVVVVEVAAPEAVAVAAPSRPSRAKPNTQASKLPEPSAQDSPAPSV
jgi:hypothetical protein